MRMVYYFFNPLRLLCDLICLIHEDSKHKEKMLVFFFCVFCGIYSTVFTLWCCTLD